MLLFAGPTHLLQLAALGAAGTCPQLRSGVWHEEHWGDHEGEWVGCGTGSLGYLCHGSLQHLVVCTPVGRPQSRALGVIVKYVIANLFLVNNCLQDSHVYNVNKPGIFHGLLIHVRISY